MNPKAAVSTRTSVKERLEAALRADPGADELLEVIDATCAASQSDSWEALSFVDQHYRRRHIPEEVYRRLKARIESLALGRPPSPESASRPPLARADRAASPKRKGAETEMPLERTADAIPAPVLVGPPRIGLVLRERYTLESRLDYSSGIVFQALDGYRTGLPPDEQRVAIRFPTDAADAQREFFRAQQLSHPNIARVLEFDRDGELAYYTMELQRGELLRDVLKRAGSLPLPLDQSLAILREAAAAIEYALSQGVVHGHLDTGSLLIGHNGNVKVLNYGLPRSIVEIFEPGDDVTALSCIAYELLAGHAPYDGINPDDAQQRGIKLLRPDGLTRSQWRALQRGIAAASERAHAITLPDWLRDMEVHRAAGQVANPAQLAAASPPRNRARARSRPGAAIAMLALLASIVAATLHYAVKGGGTRAPGSASDNAAAAPAAPAPAGAAAQAKPTETPLAAAAPTPAAALSPREDPPAEAPVRRTDPVSASAAPVASGDGGVAQIGFQSESYTVAPGERAARIPVRRTGATRGDVGFAWSTESGTARAGDDFVTFGQQREVVPAGQQTVSLYIPLAGSERQSESEFYVNIGEPSGGAKLGRIARLKVIIAPDE